MVEPPGGHRMLALDETQGFSPITGKPELIVVAGLSWNLPDSAMIRRPHTKRDAGRTRKFFSNPRRRYFTTLVGQPFMGRPELLYALVPAFLQRYLDTISEDEKQIGSLSVFIDGLPKNYAALCSALTHSLSLSKRFSQVSVENYGKVITGGVECMVCPRLLSAVDGLAHSLGEAYFPNRGGSIERFASKVNGRLVSMPAERIEYYRANLIQRLS